jgi:hypothetical protein
VVVVVAFVLGVNKSGDEEEGDERSGGVMEIVNRHVKYSKI